MLYRKLGRESRIRRSILAGLTKTVLTNGYVVTTEARAKEVKALADSLISLAVKEKDNFEEVEVKVVKAKLDNKGRKVTEKVTSKNGKEYLRVVKEETTEKRKKDLPSKLNARRSIMRRINKVKDVDLVNKLFEEIAPKYEGRVGGYTQILKMEPRKGDNAKVALLKLI